MWSKKMKFYFISYILFTVPAISLFVNASLTPEGAITPPTLVRAPSLVDDPGLLPDTPAVAANITTTPAPTTAVATPPVAAPIPATSATATKETTPPAAAKAPEPAVAQKPESRNEDTDTSDDAQKNLEKFFSKHEFSVERDTKGNLSIDIRPSKRKTIKEESPIRGESCELCNQAKKGDYQAIQELAESGLIPAETITALTENADSIKYKKTLEAFKDKAFTADHTETEEMISANSLFSKFCKEGTKETTKECAKILDTLADHVDQLDLPRDQKLALMRHIIEKRRTYLKDDSTMQKLAGIVLEQDRLLAQSNDPRSLGRAKQDLIDFCDAHPDFLDGHSAQASDLRRMLGVSSTGHYISGSILSAPGLEQLHYRYVQQYAREQQLAALQEQVSARRESLAAMGVNPDSVNDQGIVTSSPGQGWRFIPGGAQPYAQSFAQPWGFQQPLVQPFAQQQPFAQPFAQPWGLQRPMIAPFANSYVPQYMAPQFMTSPMAQFATTPYLPQVMAPSYLTSMPSYMPSMVSPMAASSLYNGCGYTSCVVAPRETNGWDFGIAALGVGGALTGGIVNDVFGLKALQYYGSNYQNYLNTVGPMNIPPLPPRFI